MCIRDSVDLVQNHHQLSTVRPWRAFVEQLQLRNARPGEIIQHNSGFGIPVPILPDTLQSRCGGSNDVPGVLSGCKQFLRGHVAVVRLFNGERRRFDGNGNMPAILVLFTQLFRGPLSVLTDSLRSDSYSLIFTPKLRLQTICCFVGGASSSERQLSPFSSRTVRSRTTEKFLRMKVGFVRARSSAVFMPSIFSLLSLIHIL